MLLGLSAIVLILTSIMYSLHSASFQRFFGGLHPLGVLFTVVVLGFLLFSLLLYDGRFAIYRPGHLRGLLLALGLAIPFAVVIILVDRAVRFPVDMNVAFPESLLFYPVMGFVADILFFILPFCLLYFLLNRIAGESDPNRIIWAAILLTALFEPIFQVAFMDGRSPDWVVAYVGVHVYVMAVVQLFLFKRYDFITMYSFRLSYYLLWHIVWGHLRLTVVF